MDKFIIPGNQVVQGSVKISGAKNAAVAILPASLIASAPVILENVPIITDVERLIEIICSMGGKVTVTGNKILLDTSRLNNYVVPCDLAKKLRASYYFLGSLITCCGEGEVPIPGGCDLGPRPIDQHLKGFSALGAEVEVNHGFVKVKAKGRLKGAHIYLDVVSVGATINIMLAAVGAEGKTVIENAAKEPEIVDLANFLNAIGADVRGAGTDVIKITGTEKFSGTEHSIIPDRIEAGTFMMAAAVTGGDVLLNDVIPKHLDPVTAKLREVGAEVEVFPDAVRVKGNSEVRCANLKTFPYPGFPTDLQALGMVLLTRAPGISVVTENIFEGRFKHVDELKRMGARIKVEGRTAIIEGGKRLSGVSVKATDLRAGAALIVAGMSAEGETILSGIEHIDRGYEGIEKKFKQLGAHIYRIRE